METSTALSPKRLANAQQIIAASAQLIGNEIGRVTRAGPGQPTRRTPAIIDELLERVSCGETVMQICQDQHMPGYRTFQTWKHHDPELRKALYAAYEDYADTISDAIEDIIRGGILSTGDRLRDVELVKHLQWKLGKVYRNRFGENMRVEATLGIVPVMLPIEAIPHEDRDGL